MYFYTKKTFWKFNFLDKKNPGDRKIKFINENEVQVYRIKFESLDANLYIIYLQ